MEGSTLKLPECEKVPPFLAEFRESEVETVADSVKKILRSGRLTLGEHTQSFEEKIARLTSTKYAIAVNSGSSALEVIFRSLDVQGKTVLVPTNTNFATAAAMYAGATVNFYDSGLYPDMCDVERKLTRKVAAAVVVHIGGYMCPNLQNFIDLCNSRSVPLIEDASHAHGSTLDGTPSGSLGLAAAFSFYPTKVITTGEGGMIVTSNEKLAESARQYRDQGKSVDGSDHRVMGNSWRMTELGASLGLAQMASFAADTARRRSIIERYRAELSSDIFTFPHISGTSQVSGHKCLAMLDPDVDRDRLRSRLAEGNVVLGRGVYEVPLHRQTVFCGLIGKDEFPVADDFSRRHICLPLWRTMDDSNVQRVIDVVKRELSNPPRRTCTRTG
ncbi:MAG: DegT/DnrJ/EryC1/StrS family aminotransferase [Spirochaetes bacterium]|nr:MAG: DegT/DnrJ/EryC1/StrS family aminotransferase [Spirochaetota bacterium]